MVIVWFLLSIYVIKQHWIIELVEFSEKSIIGLCVYQYLCLVSSYVPAKNAAICI